MCKGPTNSITDIILAPGVFFKKIILVGYFCLHIYMSLCSSQLNLLIFLHYDMNGLVGLVPEIYIFADFRFV